MSKNLAQRIAVAVIFGPLIIWIGYQGDLWLSGMVMLLAAIALGEFLIREQTRPMSFLFWFIFIAVLYAVYVQSSSFIELGINFNPGSPVVLSSTEVTLAAISVVFIVIASIKSFGKISPADLFSAGSRLMWGVLYIALLYPMVWRVGQGYKQVSGGDLLLFLFAILWLGDTAAMAVGKWLGKHKLAPTVSPNKTVEGLFGGLIGAIFIGLVVWQWRMADLPIIHVVVMSLGCSLFGQVGDLVESMWKRSLNLKDSSSIIPGHGGVLDRFDSLLFAAPFLFAYLHVVQP
jgi:phosphatidate cytidylyltransferase